MTLNPSRNLTCGLCVALLTWSAADAAIRQGVDLPIRPAPEAPREEQRVYIVQMDEPPALALSREAGAEPAALGESRTSKFRNRSGKSRLRHFDADSPRVQTHVRRLKARHDALLEKLNARQDRVYDYQYTFNGMAVKLTPAQAAKLTQRRGVRNVWEDKPRKVVTNNSPGFLGLLKNDGGLRSDLKLQGEDIVIGVIDSGITPNHPSISDRDQIVNIPGICRSEWAENSLLGKWLCARFKSRRGNVVYDPPEDWQGICQSGQNFPASTCNNKLIGARFYRAGFDATIGEPDPNEFNSPADADGHGTHIASIAAGNPVDASIFDRDIGRISGMAPKARVAVYKACWLQPGGFRAVCSVADLQMAIEDAVADGVDVINYSVGALRDSLNEPDDLALLAAAEAGIPSAVAAGNDGPDPFTILSPATTPWVIAVGATTRQGARVTDAIEIDAPASLAGLYESKEASFTPTLEASGPFTTNLVLVDDQSTEGESTNVIDACSEIANSDDVNGNVAFIQRGNCDFEDKVRNAETAGAVAVVVFSNDQPLSVMAGTRNSVNIPAVMIGQSDGQLIRDRIADGEEISITLDKNIFLNIQESGDELGSFSGRGANLADPDFLKPDLVAPGVNILGGQTPSVANGFRGQWYQYLSGTSQSTPHVAGIAALIKEAHPDWGPSAIKSALMTSSRQDIVREDGSTQADPFDMGAGHIVPNNSVDPGLLYEIETEEYDAYLCKVGLRRITADQCGLLADSGLDLDAKDLNLPSIAISELAGSEEIVRRVRNPGPDNQFQVQIDTPDGLDVEVTPSTLNLSTDETAEYTVKFTGDGAALYAWSYGGISWLSDQHRVYSPFIVQPTEIRFDTEVAGSGASGNAAIDVDFGYDGGYLAAAAGLELACTLPDLNTTDSDCPFNPDSRATVQQNPDYEFAATPPDSVARFIFTTDPNDDLLMRIQLTDELTDGNDDLDLYLYYCAVLESDGSCSTADIVAIGSSFNTGSNETIDVEPCFIVENSIGPCFGNEFDQAIPTGKFILDVHGFATDPVAGGPGAQFSVYTWAFGEQDAGNLTLSNAPAGASNGLEASVIANWNLPDEEGAWLGAVLHKETTERTFGFTVVDVNVPAAVPPSP